MFEVNTLFYFSRLLGCRFLQCCDIIVWLTKSSRAMGATSWQWAKQVSADADSPRDALPYAHRVVHKDGRSFAQCGELMTEDRCQFITLSVHRSWQHLWRSTCSCIIFWSPESGTKFQREVPLFLKISEFLYKRNVDSVPRSRSICSAVLIRTPTCDGRTERTDRRNSDIFKNKGTSLWNFVPNSGLRKLCNCTVFWRI